MYKVTNVTSEVRKFKHKFEGWVFVEPGKSVFVGDIPKGINSAFKVEIVEKEDTDIEKKEQRAERRKRQNSN